MEYRQFGRSGLYVSPLAFGTWRFDRADPDDRARLVNAALDAGVNLIDTAPAYGAGQAEEWLGGILAERGKPESYVLATKCSGPRPRAPDGFLCTRKHVIESCEKSLRRLRVDCIDLFQLHCAEPLVPIDESLAALTDLQRAGKIRYSGSSNFKGWQLVEACWCAKEYGYGKLISDQSEYHLLDRRLETTNFPPMETYGMKTLVYSPLSQGLLTGKYVDGPEGTPAGSLHHGRDASAPIFSEELTAPVRQLVDLSKRYGHACAAMALAFVIDQRNVGAAIIAPRTMEQLEENLAAAEIAVDDEMRAGFDAINPPGEKLAGQRLNLYNHGPTSRWW